MAKNSLLFPIIIVFVALFFFNSVFPKTEQKPIIVFNQTKPYSGGGGGGGGGSPTGGASENETLTQLAGADSSLATPSFNVLDQNGSVITTLPWGTISPGAVLYYPIKINSSYTNWVEFYAQAVNFTPAEAQNYLNVTYVNESLCLNVSKSALPGNFSLDVVVTGVY